MSVLSFLRPQIPGFEPGLLGQVMNTRDPYAAWQCSTGAANGSSAWPAANRAIYIPFSISEPKLALIMAVNNGATAAGNLDVGIYNEAGNRLVSSGSVAQAGTTTYQIVDVTDTLLLPGSYFMALAMDGTTGTTNRIIPSTQFLRCSGVQQEASAFPLPATFTLGNPASAYLPMLAVGFNSVL